MRRLRQTVVDRPLLGLIVGVAEEDHVVIDAGLQADVALPETVDELWIQYRHSMGDRKATVCIISPLYGEIYMLIGPQVAPPWSVTF
jgi:hypothetical protein